MVNFEGNIKLIRGTLKIIKIFLLPDILFAGINGKKVVQLNGFNRVDCRSVMVYLESPKDEGKAKSFEGVWSQVDGPVERNVFGFDLRHYSSQVKDIIFITGAFPCGAQVGVAVFFIRVPGDGNVVNELVEEDKFFKDLGTEEGAAVLGLDEKSVK